ncbi:WXG100 family type VII secretion target [Nocardioides speluncae]|uniref:WXG100 family type VII secretion target n=1 Tax=Nocardioides speluncae TaxID=2670337 RepID=UPI000D69CD9C|nr:WXG100 family type VII secretion target [Nocardioides speluncae]
MGHGDPGRFTIDADELDDIVGDLVKTETALSTLTSDLEKQIRALQSVWEGLAAGAQQEAHEEWTTGMRDMRTALKDLRAAAKLAHGNYTGAAKTNLTMWQQVR